MEFLFYAASLSALFALPFVISCLLLFLLPTGVVFKRWSIAALFHPFLSRDSFEGAPSFWFDRRRVTFDGAGGGAASPGGKKRRGRRCCGGGRSGVDFWTPLSFCACVVFSLSFFVFARIWLFDAADFSAASAAESAAAGWDCFGDPGMQWTDPGISGKSFDNNYNKPSASSKQTTMTKTTTKTTTTKSSPSPTPPPFQPVSNATISAIAAAEIDRRLRLFRRRTFEEMEDLSRTAAALECSKLLRTTTTLAPAATPATTACATCWSEADIAALMMKFAQSGGPRDGGGDTVGRGKREAGSEFTVGKGKGEAGAEVTVGRRNGKEGKKLRNDSDNNDNNDADINDTVSHHNKRIERAASSSSSSSSALDNLCCRRAVRCWRLHPTPDDAVLGLAAAAALQWVMTGAFHFVSFVIISTLLRVDGKSGVYAPGRTSATATATPSSSSVTASSYPRDDDDDEDSRRLVKRSSAPSTLFRKVVLPLVFVIVVLVVVAAPPLLCETAPLTTPETIQCVVVVVGVIVFGVAALTFPWEEGMMEESHVCWCEKKSDGVVLGRYQVSTSSNYYQLHFGIDDDDDDDVAKPPRPTSSKSTCDCHSTPPPTRTPEKLQRHHQRHLQRHLHRAPQRPVSKETPSSSGASLVKDGAVSPTLAATLPTLALPEFGEIRKDSELSSSSASSSAASSSAASSAASSTTINFGDIGTSTMEGRLTEDLKEEVFHRGGGGGGGGGGREDERPNSLERNSNETFIVYDEDETPTGCEAPEKFSAPERCVTPVPYGAGMAFTAPDLPNGIEDRDSTPEEMTPPPTQQGFIVAEHSTPSPPPRAAPPPPPMRLSDAVCPLLSPLDGAVPAAAPASPASKRRQFPDEIIADLSRNSKFLTNGVRDFGDDNDDPWRLLRDASVAKETRRLYDDDDDARVQALALRRVEVAPRAPEVRTEFPPTPGEDILHMIKL